MEQGGEDGQGEQEDGGSEDGECGAPAEAGDEVLRENGDHDGADSDSHHGDAQGEAAMAVEPVGDHDAIGDGCGAAGHGDSEDGEEEIKLPEAAACPQSGT